jgi:hypothetical protein
MKDSEILMREFGGGCLTNPGVCIAMNGIIEL